MPTRIDVNIDVNIDVVDVNDNVDADVDVILPSTRHRTAIDVELTAKGRLYL